MVARQATKELPLDPQDSQPHVLNIGRLIEATENKLRNNLEIIYFGKTKTIADELRQQVTVGELNRRKKAQQDISSSISK